MIPYKQSSKTDKKIISTVKISAERRRDNDWEEGGGNFYNTTNVYFLTL